MKGKKTGGKNFPKGVCPNPSGRPPMPEHLKKARKMNTIECQEILDRIIKMSMGEIKDLATSSEAPALEMMLAKIVLEAILRGDHGRADFVLDRLIGRVTNHVNVVTPRILEILKPDGSGDRIVNEEEE
jgi:hypothetical protein